MSYRFCKSQRLLTPNEYRAVFDSPAKKIHSEHFLLFVRPNDKECARLGLAITKKKIKHAVVRNQIKRHTKEAFRLIQHEISFVDCVLIIKKPYSKNHPLRPEIVALFDKLSHLVFDEARGV